MPQTELEIVQNSAALFQLADRAFLRITGSDATRWLNGMVTNSTQALQPGEGNYNFLLNAQGRIQGDCTLYRDPASEDSPEFLLETTSAQVADLQQHLDKFIIMDDVELMPVMTVEADDQQALLLIGPEAAARLTSLSLPSPSPIHMVRAMYSGQPVIVLAPHAPLVPRFELWAAPETIAALRIGLEADTVAVTSAEAVEQLRILEGTPLFGTDIRNSDTAKDLPQETAQDHALHFAKGCYLGQEIVERIRSRGQVHRVFTSFRLEGSLPALPTRLTSDGKPVGELTSAANIGGKTHALGYARREALDRHQPLLYEGGKALPSRSS